MTAIGVRPVPLSQTWALRHAVLRPHETLEQVAAEDESADAFAVAAFEEGAEPVAVGLIAPTGVRGEWRIRGMATAPGSRGRGAGTAVLEALLAHAAERGALRVWCNARTPALRFYERAGLRVVSEEFELPEIGPHRVMEIMPLAPV